MTNERENEEIVRKLIRNIDYTRRTGKDEKLNVVYIHEEYRKVLQAITESNEFIYHAKHYNGVIAISKSDILSLKRKLQSKLGEIKIGFATYAGGNNFLSHEEPVNLIRKAMQSEC